MTKWMQWYPPSYRWACCALPRQFDLPGNFWIHAMTMELDYQRHMKGRLHQFKTHLMGNISSDLFLETELMMLAFATGIMDAVTFPDYHVFASNQTGNTALLAVGALDIGSGLVNLQHVGLSLGAFIAGGLISGQLGNWIGCMRRVWLLASNVLQTALVFVAAALHDHTDHVNDELMNLGIIVLLAFASGAQVCPSWGHLPWIWCFIKLRDMIWHPGRPLFPHPMTCNMIQVSARAGNTDSWECDR